MSWFTKLKARVGDDRGDVPGWVLITLMTAGLVVVIWALAGPARASPAARKSVVNPSMRIVDIHPVSEAPETGRR